VLALVTHPACRAHDTGPAHPESARRLDAVLERLERDLAARGAARWIEAPPAADADLLRVHTPGHLALLARLDRAGGGVLDPDTSLGPGSLEAARRAAGAAVCAVERAVAGEGPAFCAVRPPGHHATADRAMGFCLLNNVAVAARVALERLGAARVLIVDFDVHHGNGTADAFRAEPRVHYVSSHQWPHYPGTGAAEDTGAGNLFHAPLPAGLPAATSTRALLHAVDHALAGFAPALVIFSAGFDGLRGDPLGGFAWEPADVAAFTRGILERAGHPPAVSVLEGGYDPPRLAEAAALHAAALAG
jgi:acetoin utilization deacetylase AcuC-like enzyme